MAQNGFYIDTATCSACKVCVIACKDVNDNKVGYNYRHVTEYEGGKNPDVWAASLSMACNHCAEPACLAACKEGAITKDAETGLVVINPQACIGCKLCIDSCPYGAPVHFPDENIVNKCHGCRDKLALGEKPACVAACAMRSLDFGEISELEKKYGSGLVDKAADLPDARTKPSLLIKAKEQLL
jgi:anaerobic dimethyl sulfoxide reductase subunit B (iron-sulfur subunit)